MSINCYLINICGFKNERLFKIAYDNIPNFGIWKERKKQIIKYKFQEDKYRSLGAGLLLLYILNLNDIDRNELIKNKYGKPILDKKKGFYFNLSHSGDYVVCSAGNDINGIDIEKNEICDIKIAKRFFNDSEYRRIIEDGGNIFTRIWTLKESYIKAKGKGLSIPLNSFTVYPGKLLDNQEKEEVKALGMVDKSYVISDNELNFKEFTIDNYYISICSRMDIVNEIKILDLFTLL